MVGFLLFKIQEIHLIFSSLKMCLMRVLCTSQNTKHSVDKIKNVGSNLNMKFSINDYYNVNLIDNLN